MKAERLSDENLVTATDTAVLRTLAWKYGYLQYAWICPHAACLLDCLGRVGAPPARVPLDSLVLAPYESLWNRWLAHARSRLT